MVDQRYPVRRSRGLLTPVIGGLALIGAIIAVIAYRGQVWDAVQQASSTVSSWLTDWVPAHEQETGAIIGFAVVAFVINWIAHIRGRMGAWIFALVVEAGLWLLFWYGVGIPSFNELLGLNIPQLDRTAVLVSGAVVMGVTGALFWLLEMREEWRKYRRRHHVDED